MGLRVRCDEAFNPYNLLLSANQAGHWIMPAKGTTNRSSPVMMPPTLAAFYDLRQQQNDLNGVRTDD